MAAASPKLPTILYDEEGSQVPFIEVGSSEQMPALLFIQEYRQTGETEPGSNGEDVMIVEQDLFVYANMRILQGNLLPESYEEVRLALGLKPLEEARKARAEAEQQEKEEQT